MIIKTATTEARFARRAFLTSLGASAALLPLLHAERALALGPTGYPKRIVTITWTNGVAQSKFYPGDNNPVSGEVLKPLLPHGGKVTMVAGLDYKVMLDAHRYDGHFSYPVIFTGAYKNTGGQASTSNGPSIDQVISDSIAKQVNLPMPLMNVAIGGSSTSWRGAGQRNTGEGNATRMFDKLFGSKVTPPAQLNALHDRRKSVLDFLGNDLQAFGRRMGTDDRAKIDAHLASIRQLETQLSAASTIDCGTPQINTQNLAYQDSVKIMSDMAVLAMRCDITRVVSMVWGDDGGSSPGSFPFLGINDDYHGIAHKGADGYAQKVQIDQWYYSQVANIAKQLDDTVEGTETALDHSVIVVATDMNEGAGHNVGGMPFVLIGSCGGYLQTGKTVKVGSWAGKGGNYWNGDSGVAHNQLLATLCNAMDVPVTQFGDNYSGTLDAIKA